MNFAPAGGSIAWKGDDSGFYYTRYPQGNERPPEDANFYQQVYFHKLGSDSKQDAYVIGKDFPRIAEIALNMNNDGKWLVAAVRNGDGGEVAYDVMNPAGQWTQVAHSQDGIVAAAIGPDEALYLLSRKDTPRGQILRLPLTRLELDQAKVIVPQSAGSGTDENARASIEDFLPVPGRLYVVDIVGGPSRIRVFDLQGHPLPSPPLPPISAVSDLVTAGRDVLFHVSTWLQPGAWYSVDAASGKSAAPHSTRISPTTSTTLKSYATSLCLKTAPACR